jgi:hypothetical protein
MDRILHPVEPLAVDLTRFRLRVCFIRDEKA